MANIYNINSLSFTAHENPEWFTRALFGGRLVQGGYIRVLTGIKGDELLNQIDLQNKILQIDGKDCAWTPNQIIKLSEKKASIKTYKINLEQCIDELEQKRTVYLLSPGATNESIPDELEQATLFLISVGLSNEIEEMIVGGDESVDPNQFNGFVKTLLSSADAIKVPGATLTKANVLAEIEKVYDALPEEVLQAEDAGTLFMLISYKTRRIIRNALGVASNQVLYPMFTLDDADKKNPKIYYNGVELVPVKGIGNNTIIAYDATNAFLLTDLLSDTEDIELGQFAKPNDNKVFIKGRMRLGFVVPFEDEAVIYDPSITEASGGFDPAQGLSVTPNSLVFEMAGEAKTFKILVDTGVVPVLNVAGATGFTASALGAATTADGKDSYTVTITAAASGGNLSPRTGQVVVSLPEGDRSATVTLNQRNEDVPEVVA